MKTIKHIIAGAVALLALTACQNSYDEPALKDPQATLKANTSIAELKEAFGDELAVEVPYKDEAKQTPYIIKGRVVSCDASGNIYRMLVVQDETAALALSINRGSLYTDFPLGQEVVIDVTGLWIGQYNSLVQLGWRGDYQGSPQISFMAYDLFANHTQLQGLPDKDFKYIPFGSDAPAGSPYCIISSLEQLNSIAGAGEEYLNMMSQLVEIPNVSFVDGGKATFAPYQDNADRYITDASGNTLNVRCSGYSSFYNETVPEGTGSVRGILSRYGDSWQLVLRGLDDVLFDGMGSKAKPYTVEQVIDMNNNGRTAWVKGYIVGCVKSGEDIVTSADQIAFTAAEADIDNNVVIAPEPDCRDIAKMLVVELPAGTSLREYANLIDNAGVLGHEMLVKGTFSSLLGMHGVTGCKGSFANFEILGQNIPGVSGLGSGTEESPYTVTFILNNPETMDDVWVEGYIVGFVSGRNLATGARFTSDTKGADYSGNNVLIAANPDDASTTLVIPVALSGDSRDAFSLTGHPENYRKMVRIHGSVGNTNFGCIGVNSVSSMAVME